MNDFRKTLLINITGSHLGFIADEPTWEQSILEMRLLEQFLEDESKMLLCATLDSSPNRKQIQYYDDITHIPTNSRVVVFSKLQRTILRDDNLLQSINITSLQGTPSSVLYNALHNVYTPLISKTKKTNSSLEKQLTTLQAGLRATLIDLDNSNADDQADTLAIILSVDQEVEYWHKMSSYPKKGADESTAAAAFRDLLVPLARDLAVLEALPLSDVIDMLENCHNVLDDLWRHEPPYPKPRMEHIMELISNDVCDYLSRQYKQFNIWKEDYNIAVELLDQTLGIGKHWLASCRDLTEIIWPNYSLHFWRGPPFIAENVANLVERLLQVKQIRATHRQLTRLLTKDEFDGLKCADMFRPFENINALQCGLYADQAWSSANKQFEYLLQPAEQNVAHKLKEQFATVQANTRQLLYEYGRYAELICRPILRTVLQTERKHFLQLLKDHVRVLKGRMNSIPQLSTKYETPQVVAEIVGTRQLEAKANEVHNIGKKLLDDLDTYQELESVTIELLADLKERHSDLFENWTSEVLEQIKAHKLSLCEDDPVVQFTKDKLMNVNYSPRLVALISEVRQLGTLGYNVPELIIQTSLHAKKFMNYAKYLEQIAHFHNTIGDIMIQSQRPMMLPSAIELSKLVQNQKVVSWGDIKSVETYVDTLKHAVEKLSKENNLLTSYHMQAVDLITKLKGVDLIKNYEKWKSSINHLRELVHQVKQQGFIENSMVQWKEDIDKRLADVLAEQYGRSLDTVHMYIPEIYCDLVYRESTLKYSPDEDVLRVKYDQQMKQSLDIPLTFRGVSENSAVFIAIVEKSKSALSKVQQNTEKLFEELQHVKKHWEGWLTLDKLDERKMTSWQDWELHFRASKAFGQEIAKLPSEEVKIGCFKIGLSRLRSDLESHNRSYWDQLVNTLKESIAIDVNKLQDYVDVSTATLNRQPLTLEQIGEADASHADILNQKPEMEVQHRDLMQKVHILSSWNRERIDAVHRMQAGWERLQGLMENYQHIIAKQVETIKTTLKIASENLNHEIERFGAKWEQIKPRPNSGQINSQSLDELNKYYRNIKEKKEQWGQLIEQQEKLIHDFTKFAIDAPTFKHSEEIEEDLNKEEITWMQFAAFYKDLDALAQEDWIVFRRKYFKLQDFLSEWEQKLQAEETAPLTTRMLQEIHKYQAASTSLKYLKGEDFTEKHWLEVFETLSTMPKSLDVLTLKDLLNIADRLIEKQTQLQAICKKAASEIIVRQTLAELDQWDVQAKFQFTTHKDSKEQDVLLVKEFKEHLSKIGDHQSLLQSVKNSADYEMFAERADSWETRLTDLEHYLTQLAQIQRKWIYLEPIFGSGTLANEKSRFDKIDRDFRSLLNFINRESRVCALLRFPQLRATLTNISEQLTRCQKGLDDFLIEKREKFPRFLFLGDDDLLEVVGQSSKEHVIQSHLKKLFAGIHSTILDEDGKRIVAIKSLQGEVVELENAVSIVQSVEVWLNHLVSEMQTTLRASLVQCLADGKSPDPMKYPSQVLCLAASVNFTHKCEQAINSMSLQQLLNTYKNQLQYYSTVDVSGEESSLTSLNSDIESNLLDIKLKSLLLDTIQYISIVEELLATNVNKTSDWGWQKQLRFYAESSGNVTVKMVNAQLDYSFEYIGNGQKLVRTPLTEKCFLTLTQGIHLGMGGNPYGPAGTGKTESVKALGALLGRQVLVFNCDEGIDAAAMKRILCGLVRSGAWGCFDEFNRLDEATLSAISMYIQPIQNALKSNSKTLILEKEKEIDINKHCGIFVTLNPAGGGYGGRNKLPDNLKQLFRPVVMTHPDHEQIARTLLHCDGFSHADVIGRKLVELFNLASKLLSKQQHYDWGLRALRTVLTACGRSIKEYRKSNKVNTEVEYALALNAIRLDTLSKLTFNDCKIFEGLLCSIFPKTELSIQSLDCNIEHDLRESFSDLKLQINERQIAKCVELYEQLKQRMGVALVGPPQSGKTTVRNLLVRALARQSRIVKQHVFNPKSMPRTQLLGYIDHDTRQWTDGVLTHYSLQVINEAVDNCSFIVCDGDVDPEWVESLNSVMDDNRLLSMPSGWRLQFGPNVNFIFETHDLTHASPATVSRMGIVFLNEEDVPLRGYVQNFMSHLQPQQESLISTFVEDYFYKAIDWVCQQGELVIPTTKISLANSALTLLADSHNKQEFMVNLVNAFAGQLDVDFREVFVEQMFEEAGVNQLPITIRPRYDRPRNCIESYVTETNQVLELNGGLNIPLVLTGQVKYSLEILQKWFTIPGQHILIVGPHGSAKTLLIEHIHETAEMGSLATIHCSAHVCPQYLIHKILQYCIVVNNRRGRIYRPRRAHLTIYLKNLHLLKADKWGTNMLSAFLQQLIVYHGFFDNHFEWAFVENVTIVATIANRNDLPSRLICLFNVFNVDFPEDGDLSMIYMNYLTAILKKANLNGSWTVQKSAKLSETMIQIYKEMKSNFSTQRHYIYSPHDLTSWCKGILRYKLLSNDVEATLLEVICNEGMRIFYDRLASHEDHSKCRQIINTIITREWSKQNILAHIVDNYFVASSQFNKTQSPLTKLNADDWGTIVKKGIIQYERESCAMEIEIIPELLQLTSFLSRTLTSSGGHALLAGKSGVGRRSAVKIISALEGSKLLIASALLKNDLKTAMQLAGIDGEEVYLVIEDHILTASNVLNMLNIFLSSAEVPGLFSNIELDSLTAGLRDEAAGNDFEGNLYEFFIEKTRIHLHLIFCLDIQNDNLWKIIENCPAILQNCSLLWMNNWCKETMKVMPKLLIRKHNEKCKAIEEQIELSQHFVDVESIVSANLQSPYRYVHMIRSYIDIYKEKQHTLVKQQRNLKGGIGKLTEARNVVAELKIKAAEQQENLAHKQTKANRALDMISNTMKNANVQKEQMQVLKEKAEKENVQLVKRKKEIELELAEVEPLIQEARLAIGNIKSEALSEIRSLRAPPEVIRDILEGVLRLMGIQDTSWNSMKTFLAKRGVKEDIRSFDAGRITSANREAVERLISSKHDSFEEKNAKRASVAAAPLASWVSANVRYSKVVEKIKPLEIEQRKLKQNLTDAESQLEDLSAGLLDVDATVDQLKQELATYTREGAEIEIKLNAAKETLQSAEGLVGKLIDEYERWQEQLKQLEVDLKTIPTNSILAAAFINYLSGEFEDLRSETLRRWVDVMKDEHDIAFSIEEFLSSEREQLQWQSEGLATDQLSIQNAIIICKAKMCPFLIDPSSMGINWIKARMRSKNFEATTQISPKFNTTLELAIRFGKILLVEEVETISAALLSLLRRQYVHQGERVLIHINGKLIDYHKEFQLILSSRNTNLQQQLPGDLRAVINVVNFTTTRAGLCEQLLISAIKQEHPELAEKRKLLLRQREELQEQQFSLQEQLLEDLASSQGNILENKNLLDSLNETKASSMAISDALKEASQVQNKLLQEYDAYKDISRFGSSLYFAANEFLKTNVIYSLSVASFTNLFLKSLPSMEGLQNTEVYRNNILIQALFQYIGRGIFKHDRLKFLLHLMHKMFAEQVPTDEWNLLIGNILLSNRPETSKSRESVPTWVPEHVANAVHLLQVALPHLYLSLDLDNSRLWNDFMRNPKCESNFPEHIKLSVFQKVLVVQSLRPDRLHSAMIQCVQQLSGMHSINVEVLHLVQIFKESTHEQPILLITTSGNDPSNAIRELAHGELNNGNYIEMSMGEGQEEIAILRLQEAAREGKWLILKNLHLVTSWLPILCQNLQGLVATPTFRLWLVTEAHPHFSSVLAENSLKLAYEAPVGMRNNLQKIYSTYSENFVDALNPTTARIFFVLALQHSVLLERKKYIPQAWTHSYEFSDVDLTSMVKLTEEVWNTASTHSVQWKYLIGWGLNALYGGRIDREQDLRILEACLKQYFSDEVLSHRWKPLGIQNSMPTTARYQDQLNFIAQIGVKDLPEYYGLPANVDRAWERNTSTDIIQCLKNLSLNKEQPNNLEHVHKTLQLYVGMWKKINQNHDFIRTALPSSQSHLETGNYTLGTFIIEEYKFALNIIQTLHKCFTTLHRIAKGHVLNAEDAYEKIGRELMSFKTPSMWLKLWDGPKDPTRYLKDLLSKTVAIAQWYKSPDTYYRQPMNVSHLFNAQTFLSAFKKQFAGEKNMQLEELMLKSYWKPRADCISITGLYIEGALFDGTTLVPTQASSDSINSAPDVHISWEDKSSSEGNDRMLSIPLYFSVNREKLLTTLQVPCNQNEKLQWIQYGIAFFLHT